MTVFFTDHLQFNTNGQLSINFLHTDSNIPSSPAYGVYISQLIRYARGCSKYSKFVKRHKILTKCLLGQKYILVKLLGPFQTSSCLKHIDKTSATAVKNEVYHVGSLNALVTTVSFLFINEQDMERLSHPINQISSPRSPSNQIVQFYPVYTQDKKFKKKKCNSSSISFDEQFKRIRLSQGIRKYLPCSIISLHVCRNTEFSNASSLLDFFLNAQIFLWTKVCFK